MEDKCAKNFKNSNLGENALSVRVAVSTLIIKTKLDLSDEETVNQIEENKYLQYFCGIELKEGKKPFDSSMMKYFRKRLGKRIILEINELISLEVAKVEQLKDDNDDYNGPSSLSVNDVDMKLKDKPRKGGVILDATVVLCDVKYPTDIYILNEAREKVEGFIDKLHAPDIDIKKKPRIRIKQARKNYLEIKKKCRKPGK